MQFSELEEDFLLELFNIGVGKAADSLSKMVHQEVILSVPHIEMISIDQLADVVGKDQNISCVSQKITGRFDADSLLLFPKNASLQIVQLMLGQQFTAETIKELHQEAFSEVGNIVLNACIGSLSRMIDESFDIALPNFDQGRAEAILNVKEHGDEAVLFIKINLRLSESDVEGFLAFILSSSSLDKLQLLLKSLVSGL